MDNKIKEGWYAYTDGSKIVDKFVCACMIHKEKRLIYTDMYRINKNASVFYAEAYAILKVLEYCDKYGIEEMQIRSDANAVLMALSGFKSDKELIKEIRKKITGVTRFQFHWVKSHVGLLKNEEVDKIDKLALQKELVNYKTKYTKKQIAKMLTSDTMEAWQERWNVSNKGRKVYNYFPRVMIHRLMGDFYINQIYTVHGALGPYQNRFFW